MAQSSDDQDRGDMAQLASGHDPALNSLMSRYAERLYHFLLRLLQNETEAADLAQETFVRVYLHRMKFKPGHRFSTWLYTIAANLARDLKRHRARHPLVSLDAPSSAGPHDFRQAIPEEKLNPAEVLEVFERGAAVRQAIGELPEDLRFPLILSVYEEKPHAEIAAILNCSPKSVEMRLYRARQLLRKALDKSTVPS